MKDWSQNRIEMLSPEYKAWRNAVFARDQYRCGRCSNTRSLQAHHIVKWSVAPQLRYVISNGLSLCASCHRMVTGKEESYEAEFNRIVASRKSRYGKKFKGPKIKWKPRNPNNRFGY